MGGGQTVPKPRCKQQTYSLSSFRLQRVIGTGSYAHVQLAVHKASGEPVVLKVLSKAKLIEKAQVQHTNTERLILGLAKSDFVVKFIGSFQTLTNAYCVLEFVQGGELFKLLREKKALSCPEALFYLAEVISALGYLHSVHCLYRDLKPENVLIADDGHIKLTDLGLAKRLLPHEKTITMCGTPEYMSPEMINGSGHGYAVDWWQVGILLYEMLYGKTPFVHKQPFRMYENILFQQVEFPSGSEETKDLICGLLEKDPERRLGEEAIKRHAFFTGVDWAAVQGRRLDPPFRPQLSGPMDTSRYGNFEVKQTEEEVLEDLFPSF